MEQIATPALQTPTGILFIIVMALIFAFGVYSAREEIDLLVFRLSGGNTVLGKRAAAVAPWVVGCAIIGAAILLI